MSETEIEPSSGPSRSGAPFADVRRRVCPASGRDARRPRWPATPAVVLRGAILTRGSTDETGFVRLTSSASSGASGSGRRCPGGGKGGDAGPVASPASVAPSTAYGSDRSRPGALPGLHPSPPNACFACFRGTRRCARDTLRVRRCRPARQPELPLLSDKLTCIAASRGLRRLRPLGGECFGSALRRWPGARDDRVRPRRHEPAWPAAQTPCVSMPMRRRRTEP